MKMEKRLYDKYKLEMQLYTQMSGMKDDVDSLPLEMQQWLEELDFKPPTPKCKYPHGVIYHMILDDCLDASCFKSQGKSVFTNFCLAAACPNVYIYMHPKFEIGAPPPPTVCELMGLVQICCAKCFVNRFLS